MQQKSKSMELSIEASRTCQNIHSSDSRVDSKCDEVAHPSANGLKLQHNLPKNRLEYVYYFLTKYYQKLP